MRARATGLIAFAHRGQAPLAAELDPDDLVETRPGSALATLTRAQETDLPSSAKLTFISGIDSYPSAAEEARRLTGHSGRVAVADLPLVLDAEQVAQMAEIWLFEAWAARERAGFTLPPSQLALEPGDVVAYTAGGRSRLLRITEIGEHGARDVDARGIDPDVYTGSSPAPRPPRVGTPVLIGQPFVLFLDLPLLTGDEPPHAGYVAALQSPWPGAIAFYRSPETSNFLLKAVAAAPAVTGVTLDALGAGPMSRFDFASKVRVRLDGGALASVTELALLAGANMAAIENDDGEWEVLQFRSAVLTAPSTYELSQFLRGQAGTEGAMRTPLAAGARFMLLDGALTRVDMGPDEVGLDYIWRCGPASRNIGDASYLETAHAFQGLGLRPLSPMQLRGARSGGDLAVSWVRRTRIGGDSWDAVEVPLAEETERYEVDILDGADVIRTLASTSPSLTYTAAQQTADFGAPQGSIDLRVYQLSTVFGRGAPHTATL